MTETGGKRNGRGQNNVVGFFQVRAGYCVRLWEAQEQ